MVGIKIPSTVTGKILVLLICIQIFCMKVVIMAVLIAKLARAKLSFIYHTKKQLFGCEDK